MKIEKTSVTQLELAEALGVTQPTLSEATSEGYYCAGRPVQKWAKTNDQGRVSGYEVPASLVNEEQDDRGGFEKQDSSTNESAENESAEGEEIAESDERIGWREAFGTLALAAGIGATLEK